MNLARGMRVSLVNGNYNGTITNLYERGIAGSAVTYIEAVEITYDNGLIYKCDPKMCKPIKKGTSH